MRVQLPPLLSGDFGTGTASAVAGGKSAPLPAARKAAPEPTPADSHAVAQTSQSSGKQLQQAVAELQLKVQEAARNLKFSIDSSSGRTMVRVTDANTQQLILQIPSDEMLSLDKELDRMQGLLLNKKA